MGVVAPYCRNEDNRLTKSLASLENQLLSSDELNSIAEKKTQNRKAGSGSVTSEQTARDAYRVVEVSRGHNVTGGNEMREYLRVKRNRSLTPVKGPNGARIE